MEAGETTLRTGGRGVARLAGSLFTGGGTTGWVTVILACAVIAMGVGSYKAHTDAATIRERHLPIMETALSLEGLIHEAVFHVSMFGGTGDMASYSGARIRLSHMRETATALGGQARALPNVHVLVRDMDLLRELTGQLDLLVEKKRTLNETLTTQRTKLRRTADAMGDVLLELQASIASATVRGDEKNLDERARLLVLNGFALAVEEVTGQALAAGVTKSVQDLAKAQAYFIERWQGAREAAKAAAALPLPTGAAAQAEKRDMEPHIAVFLDIMKAMLFSLEETARLNADRADVVGRLTVLSRGMVGLVRADMAAAVTRADKALTVTLSICGFLAAALMLGAVFIFFRTRRGSDCAPGENLP